MSCSLLNFVVLKDFGEKGYEYENRMKEYFNSELKYKKYSFKGKTVKMLFCDDADVDKSWYKFTIGDPKYHNNTTKLDYRRLPFLPLIPIIMEDINKCSECEHFIIEKCKKEKYKIILKCNNFSYKIVLSYNYQESIYYLISAYRDK